MGGRGLDMCYLPLVSILVNKHPEGGWIHPQRAVRQGCPLALLVFALALDTLAMCMIKAHFDGLLRVFQMTSYPEGIPLL